MKRTYVVRTRHIGVFPEYCVQKTSDIGGGVRCDNLADAAFLKHILDNLTDKQYAAACQAATDACEERRNENAAA